MTAPDNVGARTRGHVPGWVATDWQLFTDWCAAVDETPLPTSIATLTRYTIDCSAADTTHHRRIRAIAYVHELHSCHIAGTETADRRSAGLPTGDQRLGLRLAVTACPMLGWPVGLRSRRDAFLLTLLGDLRLSRDQTRRLQVADVDVDPVCVIGRAVTTTGRGVDAPARMPRVCCRRLA